MKGINIEINGSGEELLAVLKCASAMAKKDKAQADAIERLRQHAERFNRVHPFAAGDIVRRKTNRVGWCYGMQDDAPAIVLPFRAEKNEDGEDLTIGFVDGDGDFRVANVFARHYEPFKA